MHDYFEKYKEEIILFDKTIENSLIVSNLIGDIPTTEKNNFAHRIYSRLLLTSMSILKLCPYSRLHCEGEIWDFFSIASLTRCSMENYAVFHYLGIEEIDPEEEHFRIKLLYYHKNCELFKFYRDLGTSPEELAKLGFNEGLPEQKQILKEHPFFQKFSNQRKKDDILNGNMSITKKHTEILNELKFKDINFKAFYRFFSNQAHSAPLAYFTMDNERGRGIRNETEVTYIGMAIDIVNSLLIAATHHITTIIPSCKEKVPESVLAYFVNEYKKMIEPVEQ